MPQAENMGDALRIEPIAILVHATKLRIIFSEVISAHRKYYFYTFASIVCVEIVLALYCIYTVLPVSASLESSLESKNRIKAISR